MYPTGADDEQYAVFFHLKDIASHDMEWGMISVGFQYDRESVDLELEFHKQPRYLDHVSGKTCTGRAHHNQGEGRDTRKKRVRHCNVILRKSRKYTGRLL